MNESILTLNDATRLPIGKDTYSFTDVIDHPLRWDEIQLTLTDSTFRMTREIENEVQESFRKALEKNPNQFDAPKLRFEGVEWYKGTLIVYLSSGIRYSHHNVIRNKKDLDLLAYPTPMTINDLQETLDGYLLFGARNPKVSDQPGGAVIGAGFHDPIIGKKGIEFPGGIFETALKEAKEETEYVQDDETILLPHNYRSMRAIALVRGSNTDIAMGFYLPSNVVADQVNLNRRNKEYDEMFKVRNDTSNLERVLETGNLQGAVTNKGFVDYSVPLADHPLGMIEAFLRLKNRLPRIEYHQH